LNKGFLNSSRKTITVQLAVLAELDFRIFKPIWQRFIKTDCFPHDQEMMKKDDSDRENTYNGGSCSPVSQLIL